MYSFETEFSTMRKESLLLVMLFSPLFFFGQLEWGVKAGISRNKFYSNNPVFNDMQQNVYGFFLGATVQKPLENNFAVSSGLQFLRTGSKINDLNFTDNLGNTLATGDLKQQLDYITLPVMAHFFFGPKNIFSLGAGGFGSYLLNAHSKLVAETNPGNYPEKTDVTDQYEKLNLGLVGNARIHLPLQQNKTLVFGFEEYLGLKNVSKSSEVGRIKTNAYGLFAAILLRCGATKGKAQEGVKTY